MQPARPEPEYSGRDFFDAQPIDVGAFEQGTEASRWALARYLVGRAVGESVSRSLLIIGLLVIGLAALVARAGSTVGAVLLAIVGFGVLAMRAVLGALLRRLTAVTGSPAAERALKVLVGQTRRDVCRELRRAGLPSHTLTLPLLALRLLRRRRRPETMARLRRIRVDNLVTPARVDELHLLLRNADAR